MPPEKRSLRFDDLGISVHLLSVLSLHGYLVLGHLEGRTLAELTVHRGFGPRCYAELRRLLVGKELVVGPPPQAPPGARVAKAAERPPHLAVSSKTPVTVLSPARLDAPLEALLVRMKHTARLETAIERLGLVTVRDLVRTLPDLLLREPNVGRKTMFDTSLALRRHLGMSWEAARQQLAAPPPPPMPPGSLTWKEILAALPDEARRLPVHPTLPTRLANSSKRLGARTLAELALLPDDPCEWPNVGPGSAEVLVRVLASLYAPPQAPDPNAPPRPLTWKETLAQLPDEVRQLPVHPALPTRLARGCIRLGVRTIGELTLLPDDPRRWPSVGRVSATALRGVLESLRADPLEGCATWISVLHKVVGALPARTQRVLGQRASFDGRAHTFEQIAGPLGLTRERVRQIERQAIERVRRASTWSVRLSERLATAVGGSLLTLRELAERDPFFATARKERRTLVFFINRLLGGPIVAVRFGHEVLVSHLTVDEIDARLAELRVEAPRLPYPLPDADLKAVIAKRLDWDVGLAQGLTRRLGSEWRRHGATVTGFGKGRPNQVVAFLRERPGPVAVTEIQKRFGRVWPLPEQVVYMGRALMTLRERVPDWDSWSERLGAACAAAMREHGPERQWTAAELLVLIGQPGKEGLPDWCTEAWTLGSLLRQHAEVRHVGRNLFALASAPTERVEVVETLVWILRKHRSPMKEEELVARLRARRDFAPGTWATARYHPPLVRLGHGRIGLSPRDVPGGKKAIAAASRAVYAKLLWNQSAMDGEALRKILARLGTPFDAWSPELLRSVLRQDAAFAFTARREIGLSEWDG